MPSAIRWKRTPPPKDRPIIARSKGERYSYRTRFVNGQWLKLAYGGDVIGSADEPVTWREAPKLSDKPAMGHSIP